MIKYLKKYSILLIVSFIFVTIYSLATIKFSVFSKNLIDDIIMPILASGNNDLFILKKEILKLSIILVIAIFSVTFFKCSFVYIDNRVVTDLKQDMFAKIEKLPMMYFAKKQKGELISLFTNDVNNIQEMISGPIHNIFVALLLFIFSLISMLTISINLLIIYILYLVIAIFLLIKFVKKTKEPYKKLQDQMAKYSGFLKESFAGFKEVNAYDCNAYVKSKLEKIVSDIYKIEIFTSENTFVVANIVSTIFDFLFVFIAISGTLFSYFKFKNVYLFSTSTFTVGTILAFLLLINNTKSAFINTFAQVNKLFSARASIDRIDALLAEPEDLHNGKVYNVEDYAGGIIYKNVSFAYDDNNPIVNDININIKPGEKVGIVGTTGAGKTTLVNLLCKYYANYNGDIFIDKTNIQDIKNINDFVSIVLQETYLFTDTVLENIRYGRENATDDECIEAAKLVGADKIIENMEDRYNTVLDNAGKNLSEGQRQLIALARTAINKSKILVLDEATSSIDVMTEKIVKEGLYKLMNNRTSIVIAHRLATIEDSDLIIVMKNGKIIESGNHNELIKKKGEYYELHQGNIELS